ncbi:HAMP domain-containing histidine kinase [bacterium]|nr:HAMP domain-containing histidine kinase [bacterium]
MLKERNYLINTLSHDLRVSTIAQIRGLDILQKNYAQEELIQEINNSCHFTLDMINVILNTYRYKKGEKFLDYEKFNLSEIIKHVQKNHLTQLKDKKIEILYSSNTQTPVYADKAAITKVFTTLLTTAIYNANNNSSLYIKCSNCEKSTKINIIYQGKALSEEECNRMFLENPRFSTVGHGIKMYLCKKIIDFHKGKIFVKNLDKTHNSFTFLIPNNSTKTNKTSLISVKQAYNL